MIFKKRKKQVRLSKKLTISERIQNFINRYYGYIVIIAFIVGIILFAYFILMFMPGTESGAWYNGGIKNAI